MNTNNFILIESHRKALSLRALFDARHMYWNLIKSTALIEHSNYKYSILWLFFKPLFFIAVIFYIKDKSLSNFSINMNYPVFVYSGIITWWYIADVLKASCNIIYKYRSLITKINFPRIILPTVPVLSSLFNFLFHLIGLSVLVIYFKDYNGFNILYFFIFLFNTITMLVGFSLIISSVSIFYRDINKVLEYVIYIGIFLSPVFYDLHIIPNEYLYFYLIINPFAQLIVEFRYSISNLYVVPEYIFLISTFYSIIILIIGIKLFNKSDYILPELI